MRMERRSVLSPLAKSLITIVLSLAVGILVGMTSLTGINGTVSEIRFTGGESAFLSFVKANRASSD